MSNRVVSSRHGRLVAGVGLVFLATLASVATNAVPEWRTTLAAQDARADIYKNVYDGWKWWHVYCYRCHGQDAIATSTAPSLIDPARKFSRREFLRIVRNGLPDKGMQAWDKLLDDKQIVDVFLYVRARTDKVLPPGRPDEVGPNGGPWVPPDGWTGR